MTEPATVRITLHDDGRAEIDGRDWACYLSWRTKSGANLVAVPCTDKETEPTPPKPAPSKEWCRGWDECAEAIRDRIARGPMPTGLFLSAGALMAVDAAHELADRAVAEEREAIAKFAEAWQCLPCEHGLGGYDGYCPECMAAAIRNRNNGTAGAQPEAKP